MIVTNNLLEDFDAYFASQGLVIPGSIFKDNIPATPDTAIAIYEYSGSSGGPQVGADLRSIQIVSRDRSAQAARAAAEALYKSLQTEDSIINLTPTRWGIIALRQPPFKMKVDTDGRTLYCFNLGFTTYID